MTSPPPGLSRPPTASTALARPRRLPELDAFRGVAAVVVVLYHFLIDVNWFYRRDIVGPMPRAVVAVVDGMFAVYFFFLISGFVIFMTLKRCRRVRDFAAARAVRLFPAYLAAVSYTAFVYAVLAAPPGQTTGLRVYLLNLTMVQYWLGVPNLDGVYWTLAAELCFYVVMAALFALGWLDRVEWVALAWALVGLAAAGAARFGWAVPERVAFTLLLTTAPLFMSGVLFYRVWAGEENAATRPVLVVLMMCSLVYFCRGKAHCALLLGEYAVFALFVAGRMRWMARQPWLWLGRISYPLYMVHHGVGLVLIAALSGRLGWPAAVGLMIIQSVAVAAAIHYLVERPTQAYFQGRRGAVARRVVEPVGPAAR